MSRLALSAVLCLSLLLVAALVGVVSTRWTAGGGDTGQPACSAAAEGRWAEAAALSEGLGVDDPAARSAAECRCWALLALGREGDCTSLLSQMLRAQSPSEWTPGATLARLVIAQWQAEGRSGAAEELAVRAAAANPEDRELQLILSYAAAARGRHSEALAVLLPVSPAAGDVSFERWQLQRCELLAKLGRRQELQLALEEWRRMGGDPTELAVRYAVLMDMNHLTDPERPAGELMEELSERPLEIADPALRLVLFERLISSHLAHQRFADALRVFDAGQAHVDFIHISRRQLLRAAEAARARVSTPDARDRENRSSAGRGTQSSVSSARQAESHATFANEGELLFRLQSDEPELTLHLSSNSARTPDAPYEAFAFAGSDPLLIRREPAGWPERYVVRNAEGRSVASGSVWPLRGKRVEIVVQPAEPAPEPQYGLSQQQSPGDGRRRVFVVILDCGDWRLFQYLRLRGELPFMAEIFESGHRAVLESDPAFTAVAMESLVWPNRGMRITFAGLLHRMGAELAGLSSVGTNPADFLVPILPAGASLFEAVGAGEQRAANMLFSHGDITVGHHAEVIGPAGQRGMIAPSPGFRDFSQQELSFISRANAIPEARAHFVSIGSEMDAAQQLARDAQIDLLMLRLEALDLLTHILFAELVETNPDDGQSILLDAYRYIDYRLAQLHAALDRDDVLVVMSDHGIRNAMEHETDAMLLMAGQGVPAGRAQGTPALAGLPRVLADLLGVPSEWPDTGVARWATVLKLAGTRALDPPR